MRFVDSTALLVLTQSIGLGAGLVVSVLVSRALGPEGKGVFSLLLSMATMLFGVCNLGLGTASQYFINRGPGTARDHLGNILCFPQVAWVVVTSLILVSFPLWEPYLGGLNRIGILPVLVMLPFMLAFEGCCHILVATGQFNARGVGIIIQSGVVLATATILLAAGYSAVEVSYSYASGWFLGMAFAIGYIVRHYGPPRAPSIALFTETFRYSVWIYLGNLIREVSLRVDFLAVYSMRSSGEAGVYSVAAALTSGLTLIMSAIQTVFFPKTSAQSDPEARESTPFYYRQTGLVMLAAGVGMAILAYPLLLMFGREFVPGMAPMLILLIGTGIKGLNAILLLHLLGRGKAYVMTLVTGVTLFVSIMLNVTLVPGMGTVGAALATLLAFSAENALLTLLYKRLANGEILALYSLRTHDVVVLRDGLISLLRRMISFSRDYLGGRSDRS